MTPPQQNPATSSSVPTLIATQPVVFLPGIIMPAALRYAPLLAALGDTVCPLVKDLEVYAMPTPSREHTIEREVEGISRAADVAGFERFHLYGHSAGGTCALAYTATVPDRVLSLALDEPASDFSAEAQTAFAQMRELDALPPAAHERVPAMAVGPWRRAPQPTPGTNPRLDAIAAGWHRGLHRRRPALRPPVGTAPLLHPPRLLQLRQSQQSDLAGHA